MQIKTYGISVSKSKHTAYGISVSMDKKLQIGGDQDNFGTYPNYFCVTENVRLACGGTHFQSKKMTEEYMEALIPIFNKRYGEGKYKMFMNEAHYSSHQTHNRVLRASNILEWRLKNRNFNPKEKP